MGLLSWITAILALIIAVIALFMQFTSTEPINFQQCTIVNSGSPNTPQSATCNQLCGQKQCIFGLSKFSETLTIPGTPAELNSQESLVACSDTFGYGTTQDANEIESYSTSCVCCG